MGIDFLVIMELISLPPSLAEETKKKGQPNAKEKDGEHGPSPQIKVRSFDILICSLRNKNAEWERK